MTDQGVASSLAAGTATRWCDPPATLALGEGDVHVWRVRLDAIGWPLEQLTGSLSPDELQRASTFAFATDRRRFIARRGVLRLLLAGYVDLAPGALEFFYAPAGKPELAIPGGTGVGFNCSHSQGLALYAFARGRRVGIDVEAIRHLSEAEEIARQCFSTRERSALALLPPGCLEEAVIRAWTRKEAYAKAVGDGLTRPLDGIEVSVAPTQSPTLERIDGDPALAARWSLHALSPGAGYVAALVVEGHGGAGCWVGQRTSAANSASIPSLRDSSMRWSALQM